MESEEILYVTGHKNPDTDSVASAIAYAYLLRQTGVNALAVSSGLVNRETQFVLDYFDIVSPPVIENAEGKKFILVDHSSYAQAVDGMEQAEVIGIIDHHETGDVKVTDPENVFVGKLGAASTLVFLQYLSHDIAIPKDMAGVLLAGLLSDTRNMKRNVTEEDQNAYEVLKEIIGMEDPDAFYQQMSQAIASYGNMTDKEIFYSDYKKYETGGKAFGISDVNAFGEEQVKELAERMHDVLIQEFENTGTDMVFIILNNQSGTDDENQMYMLAYGNKATELLDNIFHNYDGKKYFVFQKNLSRKAVVVPAIEKALKEEYL